jgi:hypothetical protein
MPEGSLGRGIGMGALFTLAGVVGSGILMAAIIGFVLLFGIGVCQAIWMVPAYLHYKRRGETETAKGILIVAGIVFMLNATCWGVLMTSKLDFK